VELEFYLFIYLFQKQIAFSISNCESNPLTGSSVVALGPRWLAYASSQLPVKNHKKFLPLILFHFFFFH